MSDKKRTSVMWNFFSTLDDDKHFAKCFICKKTISYKSSISNLKKHIARKHRTIKLPDLNLDTEVKDGNEADRERRNKRKRSVMWNFFSILDHEKQTARCYMCEQVMSYKSSVSNLKKHIKRKHSGVKIPDSTVDDDQEVQEYIFEPATGSISKVEPSPSLLTATPTSSCNEMVINRENVKSLGEIFLPRSKMISGTTQKKVDDALLKLFYDDYQPFSMVEDVGFRELVKALNPAYEIPSRKDISNTMVPIKYDDCLSKLKEIFENLSPYVCLTTDCWTSLNDENLVAVTAHFLDEDFKMHSALLSCLVFYGTHTSENVASELLAVVTEWGLEENVILAVSDNTPNIRDAISDYTGWQFLECYAHILNSIVQDVLRLEVVTNVVNKVKAVVSYFKTSSEATAKLLELQEISENDTAKKLLQEKIPGWQSTFYMFERFIELKVPVLSAVAVLNATVPLLSPEEWWILKDIVKILRPFENATRSVSGDCYMSASLVIVITRGLLDVCKALLDSGGLSSQSKIIVATLKSCIDDQLGTVEYNNILATCTFLDPRFKLICFKNEDAAEMTTQNILSALTSIISSKDEAEASRTKADQTESKPLDLELSIWSSLDKVVSSRDKATETAGTKALVELQRYTDDEILDRHKDPLEWWREYSYMYPNLSLLVRQQFCAVAISVPCERAFPKTVDILDQRRTRLSAKEAQRLLFLNANNKFVE